MATPARSTFRSCHAAFRACADPQGREEYAADLMRLAERTLSPEHYRIFRFRFLLGADWQLCTRRLGMSRARFLRAVCRVEEQLGHALAVIEPRVAG
jgi:hypothetical protein